MGIAPEKNDRCIITEVKKKKSPKFSNEPLMMTSEGYVLGEDASRTCARARRSYSSVPGLWWANEIQPGPNEQFQSFVGWAHTWGRGVAVHSISHRKKNHVVKLRVTRAVKRSIWCCRVGLRGAGKVP